MSRASGGSSVAADTATEPAASTMTTQSATRRGATDNASSASAAPAPVAFEPLHALPQGRVVLSQGPGHGWCAVPQFAALAQRSDVAAATAGHLRPSQVLWASQSQHSLAASARHLNTALEASACGGADAAVAGEAGGAVAAADSPSPMALAAALAVGPGATEAGDPDRAIASFGAAARSRAHSELLEALSTAPALSHLAWALDAGNAECRYLCLFPEFGRRFTSHVSVGFLERARTVVACVCRGIAFRECCNLQSRDDPCNCARLIAIVWGQAPRSGI
jgi:hypothetical protein